MKIFTAYIEDHEAHSSWPMILAPTYDIDVPLVQMIAIQDLKESLADLKIQNEWDIAKETPTLWSINCLRMMVK